MKPLPKTIVNLWLDALLLMLFVALIWISAVLRFVFPAPTVADGWELWNHDYNFWYDLQFALICVLAFCILVHVMLHWSWVCGVLAGKLLPRRDGAKRMVDNGTRTLWGVGLLIVVLNFVGVALAAAALSVHAPS